MTQIITTERAIYWAIESGGTVLKTGQTPAGAITATGYTVRQAESENDFLNELAGNESDFPALPAQGEPVEAGQIYNNAGTLVLCRQTHNRTEHDPATIPDLFFIHRTEGDGYLDWIAGENLAKGVIRRDPIDAGLYITIQPMPLTITGQEPSKVPSNWQPFVPPGDTWVDSGETVVALVGAGTIRVTDTAPFGATQPIRINGTEATVSSIFTAGVNGILVISPHIPVSGGEVIEILQ